MSYTIDIYGFLKLATMDSFEHLHDEYNDIALVTMCLLILLYIVFKPNVTVTAHNTQMVGQSLILECNVTAVRGITSRVDIVWSRNGTEVERMDGVNVSSTTGNMVIYTDSYTISLLSTDDDGREYQCGLVINPSPLVTGGSITLDVMG